MLWRISTRMFHNSTIRYEKVLCSPCFSSSNSCGLYVLQLATVQPIYGNRTARSWKTKLCYKYKRVLYGASQPFAQGVVTFCLCLSEDEIPLPPAIPYE